MKIKVNSEVRDVLSGTSVSELLSQEGLLGKGGVAVAVNGKVVRRPNWEGHLLAADDDVLIINAAYGG